MLQKCCSIFVLLSFSEVINTRVTLAIMLGNIALPGRVRHIVSLLKDDTHNCGGGIIGEKFILSAAHCFIDTDGQFFYASHKIAAATRNSDDEEDPKRIEIEIEKVYIPKMFRANALFPRGDLAVVKLKENLNLTDPFLKRLYLPDSNETDLFVEKEGMVAGFGWDSIEVIAHRDGSFEEDGESSGKLRRVNVKVISRQQCQEHYKIVYNSQLCAKMIRKKKDRLYGTCGGDSGGPLVYKTNILIGILSGSAKTCDEAIDPEIYTRITSFLDFINNAMKDNTTDMHVKNF